MSIFYTILHITQDYGKSIYNALFTKRTYESKYEHTV